MLDEVNTLKNNSQNFNEVRYYPSSKVILEACYQDYIRLMDSYNKIYDKLNILLAVFGLMLGLFIDNVEIDMLFNNSNQLSLWKTCLIFLHFFLLIISVLLFLVCAYKSLKLMMGNKITVFKSEDVRDSEIYRENEETAELWLIEKYTQCSYNLRPVLEKNQKEFKKIVSYLVIGIFIFMIIIFLQKVGL